MSNAERQAKYRARKRNAKQGQSVTNVTVNATVTPGGVSTIRTASLDDYNASRQDYATRAEPERLNWGPWMSNDELSKAGLKANRVIMFGDWDYVGTDWDSQGTGGAWT